MKLLTINGYGYNLSVDGGRLEATNGHYYDRPRQTTKYRRKEIDFDKIIISGSHGKISVPAIKWLMKQKRDIAILDWNGRLVTSMAPVLANQGEIKVAQYEARNDPVKKVRIARWLIKQKIEGTLLVLEWLKKHHPNFSYDPTIYKHLEDLEKANAVENVTRIEAIISKIYWNKLASVFDKKWEFIQRNFDYSKGTRDADDQINALFNYGYSVLESECWKTVNTIGLEPYIGFIHKTHTNKASLIYDLQEPFRWLVEMAILKILYDNKVRKTDFITTDEGNVRLKQDAVKVVLDEIAKQMSKRVLYKGIKREWQTMIMIKARELAHLF
ncbi:MAG: CRISPR-associated endonuclease Cas1 [Nitrosopumilaceae archaeon]